MDRINKYFPVVSTIPENQIGLFDLTRLRSFFLAFLQFLAIFYIIIRYHVEKSSGIIEYAPVVIVSFVIYSFIPLRFRPAFLFSISLSIIYLAFGLLAGSFFITVGLGMIFICHLPIKFNIRLSLILFIVFILAIFRNDFFYFPRVTMSVMYMAPMFMFRLIIYLYEIKHGLMPGLMPAKWQNITYFFLFPNIFFLFFPIIDYKTYIKTYYNAPEKEIWQKGIRWMLRGLVHIMCYRLICFNLLIEPSNVYDLPTLLQYIVVNYSLILRLSGIFHFIIGLLCMFGLNLPEIFNNYFIATSFADLWRRINIYWRDFILKVFFYPIMFRYKKKTCLPDRLVKKNLLPITMMTVFIITWLLHSYQLFWITGMVSFKLVDAIFWLTVGACITINSVIIERRTLAGRKDEEAKNDLKPYSIKIIKIMGMLLFMSVMWSLWNSSSLEDWVYVISKAQFFSSQQLIEILLIIVAFAVVGILTQFILKNNNVKQLINKKPHETVVLTLSLLSLLVVFSFKNIHSKMPSVLQTIIQNLNNSSPNIIEKDKADIGYYDRLIEGDEERTIGIGGKSFKALIGKKSYSYVDAYNLTNDIMYRRMKPNLKINGIDHDFQTNSFGMRDKEYSLRKPSGTKRIALLGGSYQMGSGVNNDQVFEAITEARMNKEMTDSINKQYEIFNFSAGGYYLLQQVELVNTTVFQYDMDGLIYFAHTDERAKVIHFFANSIKRKLPLKYTFLKYIQEISGARSYMSVLRIQELLTPYSDIIMKWGYKEIAEQCKKNNAVPIWAFMPTTTEDVDMKEYNELKAYVETLGFVTLDMRDAYGNVDKKEIQISEWNTHPNVLGHRLIAERFYRELMKNKIRVFKN